MRKGRKATRNRIKKGSLKVDKKAVRKCVNCKKPMPQISKHHWRCHDCWISLKEKKDATV